MQRTIALKIKASDFEKAVLDKLREAYAKACNEICTDQLNSLKTQGHPCRQYVVYGKEWYLYFCNRIAENPDNVFRALIDIIGSQ